MEKKPEFKKPIESKPAEKKSTGTILDAWDYTEFEQNQLSLSNTLKREISDQGLDWRFINAAEYRKKGNRHRSHWKPYNVKNRSVIDNFAGVDPEGIITRGDLILAVRPKVLTEKSRTNLQERNRIQAGYAKQQARELKQMAKDQGMGNEVKIFEGYEDNA